MSVDYVMLKLWVIDVPPRGTRTRGYTASGSRVSRGKASTVASGRGRAGRPPERLGPLSALATSYLLQHITQGLSLGTTVTVRHNHPVVLSCVETFESLPVSFEPK